jgi:DNA-binding IclR family transcriptional regulator
MADLSNGLIWMTSGLIRKCFSADCSRCGVCPRCATTRGAGHAAARQTPLTFREYAGQVEQAKRLGYGLDTGYFARGVSTVAVAIADISGEIRFGLSGIMFSGQYDYKMMDKIGRQMIELSKWTADRLIIRPLR